jgi:glycosyltransferase involved in cell wall biosynthesis
MKILFLHCYNIFAEGGASSNRWRSIVEGLSRYDVEFYFVITSGYKSAEEENTFGKTGNIDKKIRYQYTSVQNRYDYWASRINIYILNNFYCFSSARQIKKIIKSFTPEIVFLSNSLEVFKIFFRIFPENHKGIKLMFEINEFNDIWDVHTNNRLQRYKNSQHNFYLTKRIFPRLDMCLVMTNTLLSHFSQLSGIKPDISFLKVPMTVDFSRFKIVVGKDTYQKPYIAYCGSGGFYTNGIDILIKSFAMISIDYPDLKLYIAAFWGIDGPKMLELIEDTGMTEKIIYLGVIEREEVPSFIMGAEVLVLPRPDSRQAQGGFPTKLGEYLASGNPVCVTRVGEIPEYLVDNVSAFLANPGDIYSFTYALKRALNDKTTAKRVGENGRKVALEHFSMDVQAKRIYEYILENLRLDL